MSVVVPVHGRAPFVAHQLAALALQTYGGWWEVVVADNGCEPSALAAIEEWRGRVPRLRVVPARSQRGITHARNQGAEGAEGELLLFCDADDVVAANWVEAHARAAAGADLIGGHLDVDVLNPAKVRGWRESYTADGLPVPMAFLPHVIGANFGVWRDTYRSVGGCDERFLVAGDDVDLSWRVQLAGGTIGFAPDAVVYYRFRPGLGALHRQLVGYGMAAALLYRKFGADGAERPALLDSAKYWARLLQRGPGQMVTADGRGRWVHDLAYQWGRLRGAVAYRVLFW